MDAKEEKRTSLIFKQLCKLSSFVFDSKCDGLYSLSQLMIRGQFHKNNKINVKFWMDSQEMFIIFNVRNSEQVKKIDLRITCDVI